MGLCGSDIDIMIFTHLHFDHAGGVLSKDKELLFPNAKYIIQKAEWEIAENPDLLNSAAYTLVEHYNALKNSGSIFLVDGEYEVSDGIYVEKIAGHCLGLQVVRINDVENVIYFAGDAFPLSFHLAPPITSAYDISRMELYLQKVRMLANLKEKGGKLILSHEIKEPVVSY